MFTRTSLFAIIFASVLIFPARFSLAENAVINEVETSSAVDSINALDSETASSTNSVTNTVSPSLEATDQTTDSSINATTNTVNPGLSTGEASVLETEHKMVKAIEVKGNKSIAITVIMAKIKTRPGQEYLQAVISDDLKRLYNTGFFSDVRVDRQDSEGGFKVVFYVTEKPIIENITFSKTRYYKTPTLVQKISSKKGKFLDSKTLSDDVRTLQELYSKKGLSKATIEVEKQIDELTNKVKLHFIIKEGTRVKIKKIKVEGNKTFKAKKIISVMKTRSAWLFNSGYLQEETLTEDMERVKSFYEREGFIDATTSYEYEYLNASRLIIHVKVNEGKRYYVETVDIVGNSVLATNEITNIMKEIKPGKVFSRERLSVDIANIRTLYFDRGYIFANVKESPSLNPETGKVNVKLDVVEGSLAYIHRIKIQGNDRTRDIVIRRELKLYPGERFDGEKLRRSKEKLRNLGYFEDIGYDIEDTDIPDQKDLVVQVKEAKTGSFSFGGGYSTIDQFVGFVEVEQKNFDFTNWPSFTGGGQNLTVRTEAGSVRQNTRLSFTEPWLFDYPVSGGFDAYISERNRERDVGYAYDEKRVGGDLRLGKQFTDYISGGVTYRHEDITIGNFEDNVSADLLAEGGKNTVSSLGFNLARDTRDSVFSPTRGLYLWGETDIAGGPLAGDKDFVRFMTRTSYYVPMKWDSVLEFRLRSGIVDAYGDSETVPIFERFFTGGASTIRGYDERTVGPTDPVTNDPIGGNSMLVGNIEFTFPLIDFLKLAAFLDSGSVWPKVSDIGSGGIKSGTGVGLRVKTPIGPINLDYGYPLNSQPGEESRSGKFYFSVSRGF